MKITLSRFEIRESLFLRDLSRSPKPFFVCSKLFRSPIVGSLPCKGFLCPFKNMKSALRPYARFFDTFEQNYYGNFDNSLCGSATFKTRTRCY